MTCIFKSIKSNLRKTEYKTAWKEWIPKGAILVGSLGMHLVNKENCLFLALLEFS